MSDTLVTVSGSSSRTHDQCLEVQLQVINKSSLTCCFSLSTTCAKWRRRKKKCTGGIIKPAFHFSDWNWKLISIQFGCRIVTTPVSSMGSWQSSVLHEHRCMTQAVKIPLHSCLWLVRFSFFLSRSLTHHLLLKVIANSDKMKCTCTLTTITHFYGFDQCWKHLG